MAKPTLSLKKKNPHVEIKAEEVFNPLTVIELPVWDYSPEYEFAPRKRKRRKDKEVEQYRKESRWQ